MLFQWQLASDDFLRFIFFFVFFRFGGFLNFIISSVLVATYANNNANTPLALLIQPILLLVSRVVRPAMNLSVF